MFIEWKALGDKKKCETFIKKRETQGPEEAVKIFKQYEDIIKTKNKGIINVAYHQGKVFKIFKQKEKFDKLVSELGIYKSTIIFKINVFKLCENTKVFYRLGVF